jgi:hypothetical protein
MYCRLSHTTNSCARSLNRSSKALVSKPPAMSYLSRYRKIATFNSRRRLTDRSDMRESSKRHSSTRLLVSFSCLLRAPNSSNVSTERRNSLLTHCTPAYDVQMDERTVGVTMRVILRR